MKFVFSIEGKKASDLYAINRDGVGGFYPIGLYNTYHGGLHIDGNHVVVAIADGTVVAYRYNKTCLDETLDNKKYVYSNSFVLIRHEYTTPKGQKLTFYSHYCHLCPWDEFSDEQKKRLPALFTKQGFKITAKSLNVRSSMDSSEKADNILKDKTLTSGSEVIATAVDDTWAKKDGVEEYFVFKGYTTPISIASTPSFDSIVSCEIPVKAGMLLGYSGKFETEGAPEKYTTVHVEIFAGDDTEEFIKNPKKDGDKKPTQLQIAAGAQLKKMEPKYDPAQIKSKYIIPATTSLKVTNNNHPEYVQVREAVLQATVAKECISYDTKTKKYSAVWEKIKELSTAFNEFEFEKTDTFTFISCVNAKGQKVAYNSAEPQRLISFTIPEDRAEQCWVKRSALKYNKDGSAIAETAINETYTANPALVKFEKTTGTIAEESLFSLKDAKTASDEKNMFWYNVQISSSEGWVAENDANIKKLSAFDWPGFKIAKEEGETAFDPVIDFKNLTPFFKQIVDEINIDKDKSTISKEEIQSALKNEKIANKLSHLICFHQSEWWVDQEMAYWEPVFKKLGKGTTGEKKVENLKSRIKSLCWWDDVSAKVKGFPATPNVYHFHPVAFVENMRALEIPFLFPLRFRPVESYHESPRNFGSSRKNGRVHAGCDLYAPVGTEVLAVKDGVVRLEPTYFYDGTYEIQIDHGSFIVRYGEVQNKKAPGIEKGEIVKQGQVIGYVGKLVSLNMTMLHFEMYAGTADGNLTKDENKIGGIKYERRDDLIDPTVYLDKGELLEE